MPASSSRSGGASGAISVSLRSRPALLAFTALLVACTALLLIQTVRIAGSLALGAGMDVASLERASALWPANPEFHYRLGILELSSPDHPDAAQAMQQLRQSVALAPAAVQYWAQLAWACEEAGDRRCSDDAIDRVRQLAPMDAEAVALTANYYVVAGDRALALQQFGHLLQIAPERGHDVFRVLDSAGYPASDIEPLLFAGGPAIVADYLVYLTEHGKAEQAAQLWSAMVQRAQAGGMTLTAASAAPYINYLLGRRLGGAALQVRADLERLKVFNGDQTAPGNFVFNGSFEQPPANNGFDWRRPDASYPPVNLFASGGHGGAHCLRADFNVGLNQDFVLAFQFLPLLPDSRYRLTASVRTDSITSDSGPRLRLSDPVCPDCLHVETEGTVGTTPWHPVSVEFSTGPNTRMVELQVARPLGRYFPRDITGTFWLDDVSLQREPSTAEAAKTQ